MLETITTFLAVNLGFLVTSLNSPINAGSRRRERENHFKMRVSHQVCGSSEEWRRRIGRKYVSSVKLTNNGSVEQNNGPDKATFNGSFQMAVGIWSVR